MVEIEPNIPHNYNIIQQLKSAIIDAELRLEELQTEMIKTAAQLDGLKRAVEAEYRKRENRERSSRD